MSNQLEGKYILNGEIKCITGLHIGGMSTGIEIGGLDNPVIKDPLTEQPYIPGSSLKGKIRSLLEWSMGLIEKPIKKKNYPAYACNELLSLREETKDQEKWDSAYIIARLFGPASNEFAILERAKPARLTVRDSFPTIETLSEWDEKLGDGIYTEVKTENVLDRVTSQATPRPMERVPAGSKFIFEMVFDVYEKSDHLLLKDLFSGMRLLENSSLGGSGSRGHGQIIFENMQLIWRPIKYYLSGKNEDEKNITLPDEGKIVEGIIKGFGEIDLP